MLIQTPLNDLLAAFASPDPTPGGGSAAAMASAVGVSLLMMVAGLPKTRSNTDEERAALKEARAALAPVQRDLTAAIDEDTAAYLEVVAAYKLPKTSEPEQTARRQAIQRAMQHATDVPLRVMRLSAAALEQALVVARHGHRAAASDAGVGIALLSAGLEGARLNVATNIGSLADPAEGERVRQEAERLHAAATDRMGAATRLFHG